MDLVSRTKAEIEQLIGLSDSDAEMFWALSKRCTVFALAPAVAAGAKWGSGFIAMGTVVLPGIGTVSGTTAAVLLMSGVWTANYGACMALLPGLIRFRDELRSQPSLLGAVRRDVHRLVATNRSTSRA